MADTFKNVSNQSNPAENWFLITPGPGDLAITPRGIFCAAGGDITLVSAAGVSMPLTGVPVGAVLPVRPLKVTASTGTFYGVY